MRRINEIKNLPVSELTDQEIVSAAMHRLKSKMAALIYLDEDDQSFFICRYRNPAGRAFWQKLMSIWESRFGRMIKINEKD